VRALFLCCIASTAAAQSLPNSLPSSQPSSQPIPSAEVVTFERPRVFLDAEIVQPPSTQPDPDGAEVTLPPNIVPFSRALANETFAALGLGVAAGAGGALLGVLITEVKDNQLSSAAEEAILGFQLGSIVGTGLGTLLSARSQGYGGSRWGTFAAAAALNAAALTAGAIHAGVFSEGISQARQPLVFLVTLPFLSAAVGALTGYHLLPK
jgi:hypothetical protein